MKTIWKYQFAIDDEFELKIPAFADILSVQVQGGQPCIWVMVDDSEEMLSRTFYVRGTGHPCDSIPAGVEFVGTFQMHGGALVFHLFAGMR